MRRRILIALVLVASIVPLALRAQQPTMPEPILRMTIDPARVVVGQKATLHLDVLVPNYMTAPPDLPGFQVRNAVTRQLQSVNISEQQSGTSYAGVSFEFAIYPQEPGSYAVPQQTLTIHYAAEPPATRDAVLALPRLEFSAFLPDAAAGLRPFLSATRLKAEQTVQRSSESLKTGDAVTRIIKIEAEGTPAMLLPPLPFAPVDGLALYPAQPSLQDRTDPRSDVLTATRTDSATYMLQKPGDYQLPAIDIGWWNVAEQKIERAHLDAVSLQVAVNPAQPGVSADQRASRWSGDTLIDHVFDHWLLAVVALMVLAAMAWIAPRTVRAIASWRRQRREAYLQSEAWSFEQFCGAVRHGDAKAVYFALLDWLQRFAPVAPDHSLEALKAASRDPALDHEIGSIERRLFAADRCAGDWSPAQLLRRVSIARRKLQRQAAWAETPRPLPQRLNPVTH
jgi:hypothetical protein